MTPTASNFDEINRSIGRRMLLQRKLKGMTQRQVGQILGVTLQQIQKYERGHSRISADKLHCLSTAFGIAHDYWFTGQDKAMPVADESLLHENPQIFRLLQDWRAIPTPKHRELVCALAGALSQSVAAG